jgi:hypothetical protein
MKNRCVNIVDPIQKESCMAAVREKLLNNLEGQLGKCKDEECRSRIQNEINRVAPH